jgi:hypothetical protein
MIGQQLDPAGNTGISLGQSSLIGGQNKKRDCVGDVRIFAGTYCIQNEFFDGNIHSWSPFTCWQNAFSLPFKGQRNIINYINTTKAQ